MQNFCITVRFFDRNSYNQVIYTEGIERMTTRSIIEAFRLFGLRHDYYRIVIRESEFVASRQLFSTSIMKVRNISAFVRNLRISRSYAKRVLIDRIL